MNDITESFDNFFLYVSILIPDAETQMMFNDSFKKSFTFSNNSWGTDRKTIDTQLEIQVDIGSAQIVNSPKYLIVAHQTAARIEVPNKTNSIAIFDNLNVRKYFIDFYGARYPRDCVSIDYASDDYLDQYTDPEFFYKEYVGEELLNPFIN